MNPIRVRAEYTYDSGYTIVIIADIVVTPSAITVGVVDIVEKDTNESLDEEEIAHFIGEHGEEMMNHLHHQLMMRQSHTTPPTIH